LTSTSASIPGDVTQTVRLAGCNARELSDPDGGPQAKANLAVLLPPGTQVVLQTVKPDKYADRYDAVVITSGGVDLVHLLINNGWLAPWNGRGVRPVPPWPRQAVKE
jgi:endonuclease YncB( thermonuclease family)